MLVDGTSGTVKIILNIYIFLNDFIYSIIDKDEKV